ncbi:MAG: ParB/RepB/Spo0J family partition protein [Lautropia sp.]
MTVPTTSNSSPRTALGQRMAKAGISSFQADVGPIKGRLMSVDIDAIIVDKQIRSSDNPGFSEASLRELADSLTEVDMLQPLLLRRSELPGKFALIAGERRLRAAVIAELKRVPARVFDCTPEEAKRIQRIENTLRVGLERVEEAGAVRDDYRELGRMEDVAKRWGKSLAWVGEAIQYIEALEKSSIAKEAVEQGVTADRATVTRLATMEKQNREAARATLDGLIEARDARAPDAQPVNVREVVKQAAREVGEKHRQEKAKNRRKPSQAVPEADTRSGNDADAGEREDEPHSQDTAMALAALYSAQFTAGNRPIDQILASLPAQDRKSITHVLMRAYRDGMKMAGEALTPAIIRKGMRGEFGDDAERLYRATAFIEGALGRSRDIVALLARAAEARRG